MRDPLAITDRSVLVPERVAPLLALCDGTRDLSGLKAGLALRNGMQLSSLALADLLDQLNSALLLENGAYRPALEQVLKEYREAEYRKPSRAGTAYPEDPRELASTLEGFCEGAPRHSELQPSVATLVGMVSPHIDYERGHETYAELWKTAAPALEDVELAIIFGTDHAGGPGALTLTRQDYATPLGVSPTERDIVAGLADVLGPDRAFAEEVHHINEHSIELALVWLHHFLNGRTCPIVPILCGSFQHFFDAEGDPAEDEAIGAALELLKETTAGRRTLVIAAGELAHMGPAFGDLRADRYRRPRQAVGRGRGIDSRHMPGGRPRVL